MELLNEEIETHRGVYFYAKNWYFLIEDIELRNKLLDLLESQGVGRYIVDTLSYSKLEDTGKLLYEKYLNNKYSHSVTWWLCRAICSLDYKPCIFKFVEIINEQPLSELTGHLLIGLGQMKALELKPTLFDLIKNLPETYNNETWLVRAFTDIMNSDDYVELLKIANNSDNIHTMLFAAKALSSIKESIFYTFILNCLNNNQIDIDKRYQVFQEWESNLTTSEKSKNGVRVIENIEFSNNVLSRNELSQIYLIFQKNTELSEIAFSVLVNFETDVEILLRCLIEYLPLLKYPIRTNRFQLINIGNLQKLRLNLILWLRNQLLINNWINKMFLLNCLQISGIIGGFSIVELLENNKVNILTNLPSEIEEDEIDKERYFNNIVHLIRVSTNKIRTHLNSF